MSTRSRDDTSGPAFVAHLLGSPGSRIARFTRLVHGEVLRCVGVLQGHVTEGVPVPAGAPSAVPGGVDGWPGPPSPTRRRPFQVRCTPFQVKGIPRDLQSRRWRTRDEHCSIGRPSQVRQLGVARVILAARRQSTRLHVDKERGK